MRLLRLSIVLGILLTIFFTGPLQGQQIFQNSVYRVKEIHLSGNTIFSENQLRKKMNLHTGKFSTLGRPAEFNKRVLQLDKINLTSFYRTRGYLTCSIQDSFIVTPNRKVVLYLHITEGKQYFLRSIKFTGNHLLTDRELMSYFGNIKMNHPFNPYQFRDAIDQIETRYENEGKPFRNIQSQLNIEGTDIQA
ncbi:MAG: POTRA domain-containing protein, partial [Calditrichota bacterium]